VERVANSIVIPELFLAESIFEDGRIRLAALLGLHNRREGEQILATCNAK